MSACAKSPPFARAPASLRLRPQDPPERSEGGDQVESRRIRSCAISTDRLPVLLAGQAAAVVHQETAGAGELVVLLGQDANGEFLAGHAGQVGSWQLQRLVQFGLVHVD